MGQERAGVCVRALAAALLLAGAVGLGGCAERVQMTGAASAPLAPETERSLTSRFPGASMLVDGVDTAATGHQWRAGDRVVLGMTFANGTRLTERMLMVELLEEPGRRPMFRRRVDVFGEELRITSPTRAVRLELLDAEGGAIDKRPGQLAEVFLDYGPVEVARIGGGYAIATGGDDEPRENPRPEIELETLTPSVYGMMSLLAFGDGASDNPTLAKLIQRAFTTGQQLRLLWTWGRFEIRFGDVERLDPDAEPVPGLRGVEAYDCEIRISIGSVEALSGRAVVVPTYAPLGLCGGIVAAELVNSAAPDIRAGIVLLGASRGPESSPGGAVTEERTSGRTLPVADAQDHRE